MWMPAHTTVPPFSIARSAAGTSAPTGAKITAASSRTGGAVSEPPAHTAPSSRGEILTRGVAGSGERVDVTTLMRARPG